MDTIIQTFFAFVAVAVVWYVASQADKRKDEKLARLSEERKKEKLSDQAIEKEQAAFEKRLVDYIDLPDGIRWKQAYIYWNLLHEWFEQLLAKNYGNELVCNQIKSDLLSYLALLESYERQRFLAFNAESENKATSHRQEADECAETIQSIEKAVARAIGKEAVELLASVRLRDTSAFDRTGKKPIAPRGFRYKMKSVSPYIEELAPE